MVSEEFPKIPKMAPPHNLPTFAGRKILKNASLMNVAAGDACFWFFLPALQILLQC